MSPCPGFDILFRYSSEVILGLSSDGEVRYSSPSAQEILKRSPESIVGGDVLRLVVGGDARRAEAALRLMRHIRRPMPDADMRVECGDGQVRVFSVTARWVECAGAVFDIAVGAREVTHLRFEERKRERESVVSKSLLDNSPDAILVVDRRGRVTASNERFAKMWAFPPHILEQENEALLLTFAAEQMADPEGFLQSVAEVYASPERTVQDEIEFRDGRVVERLSFPHRVGDQWDGRVWYFRDRTQERRMSHRLARSQKNEALGRLAGGVAHDFSNVLTGIHGHASLLLLDDEEPEMREYHANEIQKLAEQSIVLIRRLLTFSRQQPIQPELLNLDTLIEDTEQMLQRLVGEDVDIMVKRGRSLGSVLVDPGQMRQVLVNLAVNAREAMPEGGRLRIETSNFELDEYLAGKQYGLKPGHYIRLDIGDTGVGIPAESQDMIFEPFFTTKPDAAGLGLPTALSIVEQAGGTIALESFPGRASTFSVFLPCAEGPPRVHARAGADAQESRGSETILLVEDDPAVRTTVGRLLKRRGYNLLFARNGQDAASMAEKFAGAIHLMVTDVVMPLMGGVALSGTVRERRPNLKVLFISGHSKGEDISSMLDDTRTFFLQKPFDVQRLPDMVREILDV